MNGLLLDTCAVIWMASGQGLTDIGEARLRTALTDEESLWISPITAWEIGILNEKGRITLTLDPEAWLDTFFQRWGTNWTELTTKILIRSSNLPGTYGSDPADRIIISTARELGLTVFTGDRAMHKYGQEGYLSVAET